MKKWMATVLTLVLVLGLCSVSWAEGETNGAVSSSENFYQDESDHYVWHIKNLEGLKEFRNNLKNNQWIPVGNYWTPGQNDNLKKEAYNGYTIMLDADIDMGGEAWEPIGSKNDPWQFNGTFDGQGHTISNMTISGSNDNAGFFGFLEPKRESGLYIKNLKFDNANVSGGENAAVLAGTASLFSSISNITVTNSTVNGSKNVAGIVGYTQNGGPIDKITVENVKLYASNKRVGGIAAYVCYQDSRTGSFEKCSVNNIIIAKSASDSNWPAESGYLFGLLNSNAGTMQYVLTNCRINGKLVPAAEVEQQGAGQRTPYTALNVPAFCYGADNTTKVSIVCTETDPVPEPTAPKYYYYPSTTTTTDTTKGSPKPFDAGVGIYAVTAMLSVTGMVWVSKKRH